MASMPRHAVGSIVRARGRDWIVLPSTEADVLRLRPLPGRDGDETGLLVPFERVEESKFEPPDPERVGDIQGGLVLFDAARLLLRDGATPIRCLGRLSFTPRPYQFVPLIMA